MFLKMIPGNDFFRNEVFVWSIFSEMKRERKLVNYRYELENLLKLAGTWGIGRGLEADWRAENLIAFNDCNQEVVQVFLVS